ncbi:MAG: chromosome partitioning protein ParB, partial [Thalassolituus sp.]
MVAKKKRGLGRGLDALLASSRADAVPTVSDDAPDTSGPEEQAVAAPGVQSELRHLPVEWVQPGRYQPRRDIQPEALEELAASIKAQGLMQPIVV